MGPQDPDRKSANAVTRQAALTLETASSARAATRPIRLLHLSDLHFDAKTHTQTLLCWLLNDLQEGGLNVKELDYLVVSGDVTDRGNLEGFEKAHDFLSELTKAFALSAERCILVPGNHDVTDPIGAYVPISDGRGLAEGEWVQQGMGILVRDPERSPLRFKTFSAFFTSFCNGTIRRSARNRVYPSVLGDRDSVSDLQFMLGD